MTPRADAHIHLFKGGYKGGSFASRPGVKLDEAACYASFAQDHNVSAAFIVGYAGARWCAKNNDYLAQVATVYDWVRPGASVDPAKPPAVETLEEWKSKGFVGITLYISGAEAIDALHSIPDEVWQWLVENRWLVSVNSRGKDWSAWTDILEDHGELRLVASHLGLPPKVSAPLSRTEARNAMATVLDLAQYPCTRVKLSGFYALTDPGYDFPHEAAWPYVEALQHAFGVERLLWASDFTPCLDSLTFPQTFGLFSHMPFLTDEDRQQIEGANLLELLAEVG
jgi:L-fuconolactonase